MVISEIRIDHNHETPDITHTLHKYFVNNISACVHPYESVTSNVFLEDLA